MDKDPVRVAAGRKSKRKGNNNERTLAKKLQKWWGHGEWARTPSSGGWATKAVREAFKTCGDITTTAQDFPFCVEAKKQERWCIDQLLTGTAPIIWTWWKQTVEETPPGLIPLLVAGRNHMPDICMIRSKALYDAGFDKAWDVLSLKPYMILILAGEEYALFPLESLLSVDPRLLGKISTCQEPTDVVYKTDGETSQ